MIELNSKTQQDFLNREWVQKLLEAGVDMSDAKYVIGKWKTMKAEGDAIFLRDGRFLNYKEEGVRYDEILKDTLPTYTVSELLYKLHNNNYLSPDCLSIDILSCTSYACSVDMENNHEVLLTNGPGCRDSYIQSLASLLIQCHQMDICMKTKDTGNINDK